MVCGGSSCDIDKLELWRPTLFLEEILSVSAEIQRFSLRAFSPTPTNDHQKLYFIHFIKICLFIICIWFQCYWYWTSYCRISTLQNPWKDTAAISNGYKIWFPGQDLAQWIPNISLQFLFGLGVSHTTPLRHLRNPVTPRPPWLQHLLAPHISGCHVWQLLPSCLIVQCPAFSASCWQGPTGPTFHLWWCIIRISHYLYHESLSDPPCQLLSIPMLTHHLRDTGTGQLIS